MERTASRFMVADYLKPCVYLLKKDGEVVYVGSSTQGLYRVLTHALTKTTYGTKEEIKKFDEAELIDCEEKKLVDFEAELIMQFKPIYNRAMPDSKYKTLRCTRGRYFKGMRLDRLKKQVRKLGIEPIGVFGGEAYYNSNEICEVIKCTAHAVSG